jgi:hypothetical protein
MGQRFGEQGDEEFPLRLGQFDQRGFEHLF